MATRRIRRMPQPVTPGYATSPHTTRRRPLKVFSGGGPTDCSATSNVANGYLAGNVINAGEPV